MSIATEQKVESLLKRMDEQDAQLNELRARVKKLEEKEPPGARAFPGKK